MITLEALRRFGADTEKGLAMCMGNEALYLRLINSVPEQQRFDELSHAISEGKRDEAFEAAHALKGILGNLALTPLYERASEITELLRNGADADYERLSAELTAERKALAELCKQCD